MVRMGGSGVAGEWSGRAGGGTITLLSLRSLRGELVERGANKPVDKFERVDVREAARETEEKGEARVQRQRTFVRLQQ